METARQTQMRRALRARRTRLGPRVSQSHGGRPRRRRSRRLGARRGLARRARHRARRGDGAGRSRRPAREGPPSSARSSRATTSVAPRPCTRALIDAGVARVVVAATDPNLGEDTPGLVELRDAGIEVEHGRAGRRVAPPQPGVRTPRHERPAVRHPEDGVEPRRQDRGDRRFLPMDHRRGVARRRATAPRLGRRRGRGRGDGDRRRPIVDGARSALRRRACCRCASWSTPRVVCRPPAVCSTDPRRPWSPRPTSPPRTRIREWNAAGADVAVLERDDAGARVAGRAPAAPRASATSRACSSKGAPPSRGASFGTDLIDDARPVRRAELVGGAAAPGVVGGRGLRADRRGPRAHLRHGRADRPRHPAGGPCSPGSLRSAARCARWPDHRLTVACRVVPTDSDIGASVVGERRLPHGGGQRRRVARRSTCRTRRSIAPACGDSPKGTPVNLERPVTLAARLGGHIVQGHVDGVGEVAERRAR